MTETDGGGDNAAFSVTMAARALTASDLFQGLSQTQLQILTG